ncbi:MAG: D-alanine--D-alanine ligase, partial [Candidatus Wallbacteria bacterium]|nr:D-alanine--D-alanine ligase [Candidatus Wallbacteria bacterium]
FLPQLICEKPDLVFIALHGWGGEDGRVQGLLDLYGFRYTGAGVLASAVCMCKISTKTMLDRLKLPTARYAVIGKRLDDDRLAEAMSLQFPVVLKPVNEGSSLGVSFVKTKSELKEALKASIEKYGEYFVEECITDNKEITVSVIGSGENTRVLPILELIPKNEFYDYEAKYTKGLTEFVLPARLPEPVYRKAQEYALRIYREFGLKGFARVDMLIRGEEIYILEINTVPGMTDTSDLPASAAADGMEFDALIGFIVKDALI